MHENKGHTYVKNLSHTQKKKFRITRPSSVGPYIDATVGGESLYFTIDAGASQSILSNKIYERIPRDIRPTLKPS